MHPVFPEQPLDDPDVALGPRTARASGSEALAVGAGVAARDLAVDPAEAQCLLERLAVADRRSSARSTLLRQHEPDSGMPAAVALEPRRPGVRIGDDELLGFARTGERSRRRRPLAAAGPDPDGRRTGPARAQPAHRAEHAHPEQQHQHAGELDAREALAEQHERADRGDRGELAGDSTAATATSWRAPSVKEAKPSTSQSPAPTTSGAARARQPQPPRATQRQRRPASVPSSRAGSTTHASGSCALTWPVAYRLDAEADGAPARRARPRARPCARRGSSAGARPAAPPRARRRRDHRQRRAPSPTPMRLAGARSRSARRSRPRSRSAGRSARLAAAVGEVGEQQAGDVAGPASASQPAAPASSRAGRPRRARTGAITTSPTSATQATTEAGSMIRLEREEQSVDSAHASAAPRPPRIATTQLRPWPCSALAAARASNR